MSLFSTELNSFEALFVNQLEDLYDAEKRLVDALPDMVDAARNVELKTAFRGHLRETEQQVNRLESIFGMLGIEAERETCEAMKGLIKECAQMVKATGDPAVKDAALIAAAQRVEHYEIAGYGTARTFANRLGHLEAASLLQETLMEESNANETLNDIAEQEVNIEAQRV